MVLLEVFALLKALSVVELLVKMKISEPDREHFVASCSNSNTRLANSLKLDDPVSVHIPKVNCQFIVLKSGGAKTNAIGITKNIFYDKNLVCVDN